MGFKIGDYVRFKDEDGGEHVGILYEAGNKFQTQFRAKTVEIVKKRWIKDMQPATAEEFAAFVGSQSLTPEEVIAQEADDEAKGKGVYPQHHGPYNSPGPDDDPDD